METNKKGRKEKKCPLARRVSPGTHGGNGSSQTSTLHLVSRGERQDERNEEQIERSLNSARRQNKSHHSPTRALVAPALGFLKSHFAFVVAIDHVVLEKFQAISAYSPFFACIIH